jgi:hypothetical protein
MSKHAIDWPDAFLRNFKPEELKREGALVRVMRDGSLYCIACDEFITSGESRYDHTAFHVDELNEILFDRATAAVERRSAGLRAHHARKRTPKVTEDVTLPPEALEDESDQHGFDLPDSPALKHGPDCPCEDCQEAF